MNTQSMQKELAKAIEICVNEYFKTHMNYDYHLEGLITKKENGRYSVKINGQEYDGVRGRSNLSFEIGDRVDVLIRNGNMSRKLIDDYIIE